MRKPLIGLTANRDDARSPLSVNAAYSEAVLAAGGIPVLLTFPLPEEDILQLTDTLDGILFTGGGDIHPFFFGEETHRSCGPVFPERDRAELALAKAADAAGLPVLGICRGAQILNVALGGDISRTFPHRRKAAAPSPSPTGSRSPLHPRSPGTGGARLTPGKDRWPRPAGGQQSPPPGHPSAGAGTYMLRPGPRRDHRGGLEAGAQIFPRRPVASGTASRGADRNKNRSAGRGIGMRRRHF